MDRKTHFVDLDKLCTDLFKKEFLKDDAKENSFNVETKSKLDNMKLTAVTERAGAAGSGELKLEAEDKANGIKITESWNSANALNFKLESTGLVDSAKFIADAKYKEEGTKDPEKSFEGGFEYVIQGVAGAGSAVFDKKGINGKAGAAVHFGDFSVGVAGSFPMDGKSTVPADFGFKAAWTNGGFVGHLFGVKKLTELGVGAHHKVNSDSTVGVRVSVQRSGEPLAVNKPLVEVCGQKQLCSNSNLKLKFNSVGAAAFAYNCKINKSATLGFKGNVKLNELFNNASACVLGLSLKFDF